MNLRINAFSWTLILFLAASAVNAQESGPEPVVESEDSPKPPADFGQPASPREEINVLEKRGAILFNVGGLIWYSIFFRTLVLEPEFQYIFTEYVGLDLMPRFQYFFGTRTDIRQIGGGGSVGLRIMPMGTGILGLYLVPRILFNYLDGKLKDKKDDNGNTIKGDEYKTMLAAPSIEVGYSWIWGSLIMNIGGQVGYSIIVSGKDIFEDTVLGHWRLLLNASIGYAF